MTKNERDFFNCVVAHAKGDATVRAAATDVETLTAVLREEMPRLMQETLHRQSEAVINLVDNGYGSEQRWESLFRDLYATLEPEKARQEFAGTLTNAREMDAEEGRLALASHNYIHGRA